MLAEVPSQNNEIHKDNKKGPVNFYVQNSDIAKNYGIPIKYFIPEWDDRVDPQYNFLTDESVDGRDPYSHDVYAHEIYDTPNYDGILFSKVKLDENKKKVIKITAIGAHEFIRAPKYLHIMGDCGAFGYINEIEPPYQTQEIIDYYSQLGFDYGVSIDHLIVGDCAKDPIERKRRFEITRDNADEFLMKWKSGNYSFKPIGVAQGWDPQSYREAVYNLVEMGYQYVALGGLVRTPSKQIYEIMKVVRPVIPEYLRVHLFGIARLEPLKTFRCLGMTSFDSASYLRRAWLGSGSNYFTLEGNKYTAVRVPPVDGHGIRVKQMVEQGKGTKEQFRELEKAALEALRNFDKGLVSIEETLDKVLLYDQFIGDGREQHAEMYRRVLEDKPWKKCECKICREIGIEVIIFRGNNRNRRRGFHNTYVFYQQFKNICK